MKVTTEQWDELSHNVNNKLLIIRGYSEMLQKGDSDPKLESIAKAALEISEYLKTIKPEANDE